MPTVDEYGVLMLVPETEPVPESELHAQIVDLLYAGLAARFADRDDVVVAERMAWFPDAEDTRIRQDPDVMVVFGRPRRRRVSYKAWAEEGIAPTVIIEVKSPSDIDADYDQRLSRAAQYGVAEVVLIDPFVPGGAIVTHLRVGDGGGWQMVGVSAAPSAPIRTRPWGSCWQGGSSCRSPTSTASGQTPWSRSWLRGGPGSGLSKRRRGLSRRRRGLAGWRRRCGMPASTLTPSESGRRPPQVVAHRLAETIP